MVRPTLLSLFLLAALPPMGQEARAQEVYTLEALLEMGRARSPTLGAFRAEHAAMRAERKASSRFQNPEVEYERGTGDPFGAEDDRTLEGFSVRQSLENPFSRHYRLNSLEALAEAADEDLRYATLEVEHQIRVHFFRILYLETLLEQSRLNEEALAEVSQVMDTRARLGEVRQLEAIRLRVEHLRARVEVEGAEMELAQLRSHLNTYLGNALPPGFRLSGRLALGPEPPPLEEVEETALPSHPLLLKAAREREAAEATRKSTSLSWIPSPTLLGASKREMDGDVRVLGIGFRVPVWNLTRDETERDRQRVRLRTERERALRLEVESELMIHLNRLRLSRRTVAFFREGLLAEAEASMGIAEAGYREGEVSLVEYLDARRSYRSIQIQYQEALLESNLERAALIRAAGGVEL